MTSDPSATAVEAGHPPGPSGPPFVGSSLEFSRGPLDFFERVAREYGPVASYVMGGDRLYQVTEPSAIEHVLVRNNQAYTKGELFHEQLDPVLGRGLLTNEGDFWRRERHRIEPAFHPARIDEYAATMTDLTGELLARWRPDTIRNVHEEMMALTADIAAAALFDVDLDDLTVDLGAALEVLVDQVSTQMQRPLPPVPAWVPTPENVRYRRARDALYDLADEILEAKRGVEGHDVVSLLLAAQAAEDDPALTDEQIRAEIVTLLLAGHETTALTLTYACYLLAHHSDVAAALHEEVVDAVGEADPTPADVPALPTVGQVVDEALRLYPPAYDVIREPTVDDVVGGYRVPAGTTVVMPQWVVHRDPRFYDDPEAFRPERWTDEFRASLPNFAYYPFGGGPRRCVGDRFALMEARLVLATIVRDWRFAPVTEELSFAPSVSLRPAGPVKMAPRRW